MARYPIKLLQGLTLVELLISLVLGALLFIMMLSMFLMAKKMLLTQQGLTRIQTNARTIDHLLGKAIRNSGSFSCQHLSVQMSSRYGIVDNQAIKGIVYQDIPKELTASRRVLNRVVVESDILWIQGCHKLLPLVAIREVAQHKMGTRVVLSDCQKMTAFSVTHDITQHTQGFAPTATFCVLSSTVYYVAHSNRNNSQGDPILSLYSTDFNGRTIELVEGVEKCHFTYGLWINGRIEYLRANEVQNWQQVVSIRLQALLNTVETQEPILQKWWYFEWPLLIGN